MTTKGTTTATAEPRVLRARGSGISVRVRITATVAVLVGITLAGAGLLVYTIESQRIEQQTADDVDQELDEFRFLSEEGTDPESGEPFASVRDLLVLFMQRNVPDDDELLVGWVRNGVANYSPQTDPLAEDPAFLAAVAPIAQRSDTVRFSSQAGELMVTSYPVQLGDDRGALMVVVKLDEDRAELLATMRTYAIVAGLSMLLLTVIAFWQSGRLLAPLRTLRDTAEEISETDLSLRLPVSGHDDITALTRTFNGMLDRLEDAFTGQRRFLDDAGHELKTPLTVLRGHLELLDSGSPEEIAETKELLLDETDRMSRLVGDLILLAKSDRPDFLQTRDVDLDSLTRDLVTKARGLGDRAWTVDATAPARIVADEQRLTQAVLQLADNAAKHTRAGDTIAIGSSYDGRAARLWVRDTGRGVPPEDRQRIFERFGRSAVLPGDEGFGLGLSIVGAIARAHGGTVAVEDAEPTGARFVITLPSRSNEEDPWPAS